MEDKKRIVILFKEPINDEWVESLIGLLSISSIEIVGVFIEEAMHLTFWKFFLRILKRIKKKHIYLPEFVKNVIRFGLSVLGRKHKSLSIYDIAKENKIAVYRVKNIEAEENLRLIRELNPNLGIIYFQRILPEKVFSIPKEGSINIHYGILPRYAGSHTIFWALTEGVKEVGLTIHKFDTKVDYGDILLIKTIPTNNKTASILGEEIRKMAPPALKEAVLEMINGRLKFYKQIHSIRKYWEPPTFLERIKYRRYL